MGVTVDKPIGMPTADDIGEPTDDEIAEMGGEIDYSEIQRELEKAKEKISGKPKEKKPKEPEEPEEKEPETKGSAEDAYLDQLNSLIDGGFALAEAVFQVCHYNDEYNSEASLADVAFELTETDEKVHQAVIDAYEAGEDTAKEFLEQAKEQGLVEQTEHGGYVITDAGREFLEENKDKLGHTFESKKHSGEIEAKEPAKEPDEAPEDVEIDEIEEIEEPEEPSEDVD